MVFRHQSVESINDVDAVADPEFANGGGKVERHRGEYRGAEGADGVECGEWVSPLLTGALPPPQKIFLTLDLKMSTSSAF